MIFNIGEYEIKRSDENNITLSRTYITAPSEKYAEGREITKIIGYYSDYKAPLKKLISFQIDNADTAGEVHEAINELEMKIDNYFKKENK